jgi:stage II sporulation protein D (peptidoglycan lytic transglycosylase)
MGSGHGVGFCQWGAVGRARAGQGYEQILLAYFPGTRLERRY